MKCPKCSGFMYIERFADFYLIFHAWKCVNCGSVMDQTILSNRARGAEMELQLQTVTAGANHES